MQNAAFVDHILSKGHLKTRKNLRFDGLKALKNARITRREEWFCKDISTKLGCQGNEFGKP